MALSIAAAINFDSVVALRKTGQDYIDQESAPIFDFVSLAESDSSALSLMLVWRRYAASKNKTIQFKNVPASLVTLAAICNVSAILGIQE